MNSGITYDQLRLQGKHVRPGHKTVLIDPLTFNIKLPDVQELLRCNEETFLRKRQQISYLDSHKKFYLLSD